MEDQRNPLWMPYGSPPPDRKETLQWTFRRYSFPVLCFLFIGCAGVFLLLSDARSGEAQQIRATLLAQQQQRETAPSGTAVMDTDAEEVPARRSERLTALSVSTRPAGATVLIDGDSVGRTPLDYYALPAGVHRISIQEGERLALDTTVALEADQMWTFVALLGDQAGPESRPASKNHVLLVGPSPGERPAPRRTTQKPLERAATASAPPKEKEWRESKEARQARIQGYVEEVQRRRAERRERLRRQLKEQAEKGGLAADTGKIRRKW